MFLDPLQRFLAGCGRKIKEINGDGNCFFRTLSHILLNTEEEHLSIRDLLVRFENLNSDVFEKMMTEVHKPTFREHINHIMRLGKWATHVEVLAAATYFQLPVYFCEDLLEVMFTAGKLSGLFVHLNL